MGNSIYVIDTCSLTALPRAYPMDIFQPVWSQIEDLVASRKLISCEDVYLELEAQDDELLEWAKLQKEKGLFLPLTAEVQAKTREVLRSHPNLLDLKKRKSSADAFLVGMALHADASLVTEEKPSGGPEKSKIPDVCRAYGIPCINLVEKLRVVGFKL
jgi:hypothetical protein